MRLPEIRAQLHVLAADIEAAGLADKADLLRALAEETRRRSPIQKTPPRARGMTDEVADQIRRVAAANPDLSFAKIGAAVGVNQGRVSEVLAGFRT